MSVKYKCIGCGETWYQKDIDRARQMGLPIQLNEKTAGFVCPECCEYRKIFRLFPEPKGKGKFFVIEGTDGTGKATQADWLTKGLYALGYNVKKLSFPCYGTPACAPVEQYLAGAYGSNAGDVNAYAASLFYAVDRFASYKTGWGQFLEDGGIIVADRYTTSNAVHQCAKLPMDQWDEYLDWLFDLEYSKMGLPEPDAVFFLDMPAEASQKLMTSRYHGDESKKDIHEKDLAFMRRSREAAEYCAEKFGWHRIECAVGNMPRPVEEIAAEVKAEVEKML